MILFITIEFIIHYKTKKTRDNLILRKKKEETKKKYNDKKRNALIETINTFFIF
jgi:hypothetical protein